MLLDWSHAEHLQLDEESGDRLYYVWNKVSLPPQGESKHYG